MKIGLIKNGYFAAYLYKDSGPILSSFGDIIASELLKVKEPPPPEKMSLQDYVDSLNSSMNFGPDCELEPSDIDPDKFLADLLKVSSNGYLGRFAMKNASERFVVCKDEEQFIHHHCKNQIQGLTFMGSNDIGLTLKDNFTHLGMNHD